MCRVLDHVDIRVSDHAASRRFYDTVLTVLGLERRDHPDHVSWGDFSIAADGQPVAKHLHIAFYAPSHELVDAFHRAGVEAGYTDDGAPGPRPQYREDYYGAFLLDPDGNSVEAVYTGLERETGEIDHLWLRTRDGWRLVDFSFGHSDAFFVVWPEQYGVSRKLLGMDQEPEADKISN